MDIILLKSFLPEIFLSFCILSTLVFNIFITQHNKLNSPILDKEYLSQCFFILICCLVLVFKVKIEGTFANFIIVTNHGSELLKGVILLLSILVLVPVWRHYLTDKLNFSEFFILYLLAILVFLLILNANDLLVLYLLIEMQSLIFYVLANFKRTSAFSTEAGLKYFISGSVFSGFFLFGCSILYGVFGTLNYNSLELLLSIPLNNVYLQLLVIFGVVLITGMFLFKLTIAPFHVWSPDVYEGAPMSATIILSTLPKLVLLTVLMRWMVVAYYIFIEFSYLFVFLGLLSIFFGIFFANRQKRLKRFIAYSSISQLGYAILFLSIINYDTYSGVYFFVLIYLIASLSLWSLLVLFDTFNKFNTSFFLKERTSVYVSNFANYIKYNKGWAFTLLIILASLAGIPPLSGFLPKVFVFISLTEYNKWFVNIILVVLTCLVIWYYVNVMTTLFMEVQFKNRKEDVVSNRINHSKLSLDTFDYMIIVFSAFLLLYLFINPSFIYLLCQYFAIYLL